MNVISLNQMHGGKKYAADPSQFFEIVKHTLRCIFYKTKSMGLVHEEIIDVTSEFDEHINGS